MNMNRILTLGLLAMTAAMGAAQAEVQAKFHLPFGARWGEVNLAPGDYKLSIPDGYQGVAGLLVQGAGKTGFIQPQGTDHDGNARADSQHSYLQLEKVNGTFFVTQFRSAATGETFHFALPKQQRHRSEKTEQDVVKIGVGGN